MTTHYSKFLGIKHKDLQSKGVYDGYIEKDSLLHLDPLLLRECDIPEFAKAYKDFLKYFESFIILTKNVKEENIHDRFFKQMVNLLTFSEISNTGLGYSVRNTKGRGVSGSLSIQLAKSAYEIIKAGLVDPEIFGLMPFIEDNIGSDRISDMTLSILHKNFLLYTQRISMELKIVTQKYRLNGVIYEVPFYRGQPMHFIPMKFLADIPIAHDYDDIDNVCNYNNELKKRVANIIGVSWSQYKDYKKSDWREIILHHRDCYDAVINYYKRLNGIAYDFIQDNKNQYNDIYLAEILEKYPLKCPKDRTYTIEEEIYNLTLAICNQFKHLVEDNRISELFYRKKRTPDETDWQMLLYTIADTYKEAASLDVAITREDNPGVGEMDFHITKGAQANTVIEIKRSNNKNLIHGYRSQLVAYMKAERAKSGIFIVIVENGNADAIKAIIKKVQTDMRKNGEYIPEVIYINGSRQLPASNYKYTIPCL